MKLGDALYHLQSIELTIIDKRKRIQAIGREMASQETLDEAREALQNAEEAITPLTSEQSELEWQLESTQSKREGSEKRLYDGSVTKPKELQDLQKEINSLTKRGEELEKQLSEVAEKIEKAQNTLAEAEVTYSEAENARDEAHAVLEEEKAVLEEEIEVLLSQRREHLPNIDEASLEIYNNLRRAKGNRPVSQLIEDSCSVCGVEQTIVAARAVRQNEGLSYCTNCKRILVYL